MKRGAPDHPKMYAFAEALGVRRPVAVGYIELLIHFTAQYAPQGDIGRYSNRRIAAGMDWPGNPDKLINALISSGWVDEEIVAPGVAKLVVHHWGDHIDRVLQQRLDRRGLKPYQKNQRDTDKVSTHIVTHQGECTMDMDRSTHPLLKEEPESEEDEAPKATRVLSVADSLAETRFLEIWEMPFWRREHKKKSLETFKKIIRSFEQWERVRAAVVEQMPGMLDREVRHRPLFSTWLNGERWNDEESPQPMLVNIKPQYEDRNQTRRNEALRLLEFNQRVRGDQK